MTMDSQIIQWNFYNVSKCEEFIIYFSTFVSRFVHIVLLFLTGFIVTTTCVFIGIYKSDWYFSNYNLYSVFKTRAKWKSYCNHSTYILKMYPLCKKFLNPVVERPF